MRPVAVMGASGYLGGLVVARLQELGRPVRALARSPERLRGRLAETTEAARADVLEPASLPPALAGAGAAVYLVHSLGSGGSFSEDDRAGAAFFGAAAAAAGLERIVYLGGLGEEGDELSDHLASRQEVGRILRSSGVPTVELRASIVVGAGSASFELVRSLVESLPALPLPDFLENEAQPIAVDDVVEFLVRALDVPLDRDGAVFEIGGADRVSYLELVRETARRLGLEPARATLPVPGAAPLPAELLARLAPGRARVALNLLAGLRNSTVVRDGAAARAFPQMRPLGYREAIERALAEPERGSRP